MAARVVLLPLSVDFGLLHFDVVDEHALPQTVVQVA